MKNKKFQMILTNFVTLLRTIGVLALVPVYKIYGGFFCSLLTIGCFLTDFIDGQMARHLNTSTFFGSLFDGTSDKLFLIANMFLLLGIFPHAWILILLELAIAGTQTLKYKNNLNVKSNFIGKFKMCVLGVSISLTYLLVDYNLANYIGSFLATKLQSIDKNHLFTVMVLSEIATLSSYALEFIKQKEEPKKEEKIKEEMRKDIEEKDLKELLFDHEFYNKYKDSANLMELTSEVLVRKRVKK